MEPIRYMVVCDHPEQNRRYLIVDIDDNRPAGGIRFDPSRDGYSTTVAPRNKLGSRQWFRLTCGACSLNLELSDTSVPELLDMFAPHRHLLASETTEIGGLPALGADELFDVLVNQVEPQAGWVGWVRDEQRYVIPFKLLSAVAGKLRSR